MIKNYIEKLKKQEKIKRTLEFIDAVILYVQVHKYIYIYRRVMYDGEYMVAVNGKKR